MNKTTPRFMCWTSSVLQIAFESPSSNRHSCKTRRPKFKPGLVLHRAWRYDPLVWLFSLGRERAFRKKFLRVTRLKLGEVVLDVGCGTGLDALPKMTGLRSSSSRSR
ncbi:hypothetical protein ACDY96_17410 [Rhizobium mongolense]|uniref:hypothetical protein n=1 Tax=Rhizobium mongolense TaxID=57676 RepID=UPI0035580DBA